MHARWSQSASPDEVRRRVIATAFVGLVALALCVTLSSTDSSAPPISLDSSDVTLSAAGSVDAPEARELAATRLERLSATLDEVATQVMRAVDSIVVRVIS